MAKDLIHLPVKNALIKQGWTITHDPFYVNYEGERLYADLGIERSLVVERGTEKRVVEIKSFAGESAVQEFKTALGQYIMYQTVFARHPSRP